MKSKSAEVKGKLLEYIVNPTGGNNLSERHVSPNDRGGKRYRGGGTVFTIDDSPTGKIFTFLIMLLLAFFRLVLRPLRNLL